MKAAAKKFQRKGIQVEEGAERTRAKKLYTPDVDIIAQQDDIILTADMPGVDENSVDITLEKDTLTIYGKVETEIPENHRLTVCEYGVGDYQRAFTLSDEIDRDRIQATVKNGVLRLVLPKAESAKTRKIPVKAGA